MSSLRVLVLADASSFHTQRFVHELQRQGVIVSLASCEFLGTDAIPIRKQVLNHSLRYLLGVSDIRRLLEKNQYDVVNAHYVSGYGFLASRAVVGSLPVVLHAWGSDILIVPSKSIFHMWKTRQALRRSRAVIADSEYLADEIRKLDSLVPTEVIPWGVESDVLIPITPKEWKRPLRLISPRRLEPVYGLVELILGIQSHLRNGDVSLTIPGFGSQRNEIEKMLDRNSLFGVLFYDLMPRENFIELLRSHDIYCSNSASDSSPVSLLESQAVGLFPIVRDHPGVRAWMPKHSGLLVGRDCETFAMGIDMVLGGTIELQSAVQRNQERVKEQAVWEKNVAATIRIFEQHAGKP